MKINLHVLSKAIDNFKHDISWSNEEYKKFNLEVEIISENPGEGLFVDTLVISAVTPENAEKANIMQRRLEIYDTGANMDPTLSKTEKMDIK